MGSDESRAESKSGVMSWYVNPMTDTAFQTFKDACAARGKRLCTSEEWSFICGGDEEPANDYIYGNTFNKETCNCVDTFCDDYCAENSISPCNNGTNCGYEYYCFHEVPTGSFPDCTGNFGTYDLTGNLWEIVTSTEDSRGYEVRGGAFNCGSPSNRLRCSFNAGWQTLYAGFRCCKDYS